MKKRILENHERMNNRKIKIWVNTIKFSSLEFPNLCLMAEARLQLLSDIILSICKGNI